MNTERCVFCKQVEYNGPCVCQGAVIHRKRLEAERHVAPMSAEPSRPVEAAIDSLSDILCDDALSEAIDAEQARPVEAQTPTNKQREIDIANLRFYAEMFRQHEWSTVVIHWGVFEQTLNEIAARLEVVPAPPADTPATRCYVCDGLPCRCDSDDLADSLVIPDSSALRDTTAMLNAAIRIVRTIDERLYAASIALWSEQVMANMAEICAPAVADTKDDKTPDHFADANKMVDTRKREMELALRNCRMLAQREIRNHEGGGQKPTGVKTFAAWKHILRFCEEAGVTGSILRVDADTPSKEKA